MADENVRFRLTAESDLPKLLNDLDALIRKQEQLGDENSRAIKSMNSNVESHSKQYTSLGNSITGVKNLLLTAFGIDQIKEAISKIFDLTATYQKYHAALTVSMGSQQKATEALGMLQTYADKSNFTLDELADTFSKFAGRNVNLGRENMEKLGDVANALQKPFKDLGEAILDINNTERWTELGIKAKTSGDKVSLTFRGVTIEAERTEQSVMLATAAFGTLNGVQGATEKQALTLAGRWSSLSDATAGLAREAGNGLLPVFEAVIETGISLAVGMKNSAQEGGFLNAMFSSMAQAGRFVLAMFTELITPIKEIAVKWFPQFFGAAGDSNELMKVLGVVINTVVMGPFYTLITVLREGWQALQLFYNGLQGVQIGMKGVWAAITGDWDQMGVLFSQASGYFDKSKANFEKMGSIWDEMSYAVEKSNAKIMNSHQVTAVTVADITTNLTRKQQEAVAAENQRWEKIKSTLEEGTAKYAQADYEHNMNLLKAKDQYTATTVGKEKAKHTQLKDAAKISADEIQQIELGTMEQTYDVRQKIIENNTKIEIDKINERVAKHKLTEEAGVAEILAIQRKKTADLAALEEEKNIKIEELTTKLQAIVVQANQEAGKEVIKINEDMVKKIVEGKMTEAEAEQLLQTKVTELRKKTADKVQKIEDDTTKIINETRRNQSEATQQILEEWIGNYSEMAGLAMSSFNDYTNSLENMKVSQAGVSAAQDNLNALITSGKASSEELANAKKDLSIAQDKEAESAVKGAQASLGLASAIAQVAESIKNYLVSQTLAAYEAINEAIGRTKDVIAEFYDATIESNRTAMEIELENFQGSYEQRKEIMETYFARERELAERKDTIVAEMEFQQRVLTSTSDTTDKISKAWDISKGPIGPAALFKILTAFKEHHAEVLAAAHEREAKEAEMRIRRTEAEIKHATEVRDDLINKLEDELDKFIEVKEAEINKAEDARDAQVDALKSQLDAAKDTYEQQTNAVKEAYDQQLAALKEKESQEKASLQATYDFKQQLLAQSKADENEAITIIDRLRNEALERYRTDEVNRLAATRDRILATLTDEKEREEVTNAYAQKIADVHTQVEEAKLDKTKGVSLATKQLNQEAKDGAVQLKEQEKEAVNKLEDDYQTKFTALANDRDAKLEALKNDYVARETAMKATITQLQTETAAIIKRLEDEVTAKKQDASTQKAAAERDYANFVLQANKQIMQSQIQMAIAQIRAEIAMLQGKRNIFNRGKIDAAVGDLQGSIRDLEALMGEGTGGIVTVPDTWTSNIKEGLIAQRKANRTPFRADNLEAVNEAFDQNKNAMTLTFTDEDRQFTAYDAAGNSFTIRNATGYVSATGKSYFEGTPWVDGLGYPDGRDTVPAMVDKGERIVKRTLNEKLGKELPNEKLVDGYLAFEELQKKFGSLRIEEFGRMNFNLEGDRLGTSVDLKGLEKEVKNLTDVIRSKPELKINVDANRVSIAEVSHNQQHVAYYENLYKR